MIKVTFFLNSGKLFGFIAEGHANSGTFGNDVVCAAVSSAAYLTINTVTDIIKIPADCFAEDGKISITVDEKHTQLCQSILRGFEQHINSLKHQYPKNIKVIYGGCKNA